MPKSLFRSVAFFSSIVCSSSLPNDRFSQMSNIFAGNSTETSNIRISNRAKSSEYMLRVCASGKVAPIVVRCPGKRSEQEIQTHGVSVRKALFFLLPQFDHPRTSDTPLGSFKSLSVSHAVTQRGRIKSYHDDYNTETLPE